MRDTYIGEKKTNITNYNTKSASAEEVDFWKQKAGSLRRERRRSISGGIFSIVLMLLLGIALYSFLSGSDNFITFGRLLEILAETPTIDNTWLQGIQSISDIDWSLVLDFSFVVPGWYVSLNFNFLKVLWNLVAPFIELVLFMVNGLFYVLSFVFGLIKEVIFI